MPGADVDAVLLATGPPTEPSAVLPNLLVALGPSLHETGVAAWFVNAMVPLLKLQRGDESVDLLWLGGCIRPIPDMPASGPEMEVDFGEDEDTEVTPLKAFDVDQAPVDTQSPAADCILLSRLFRRSLLTSTTFTASALRSVRAFARRRHLYGSKYGYPGGSAWCTLLWAFCQWLDQQPLASSLGEAAVLHRFFTVLAVWPWPLPWTTENMSRIVAGHPVDGSALEVSLGRHQATSFVVPLPTTLAPRVWNMTQSVQVSTQRSLLREAWAAALSASPPNELPEFRHEMREYTCQRHGPQGTRWPVYLCVELPLSAPPEWRGIVGARLMSTLLPQLEACGFFPRPLCVDEPSYLVLLWPVDATWSTHAPADLVLPLRGRILPCMYAMLQAAYVTMWGTRTTKPRVESLLPSIDVQLADL